MEPRNKGLYCVEGYTKRNNYILKDSLGNTCKETYPLHMLKKVIDSTDLPEHSAEVDRILDHKVVDNKWVYLVKWKELPASENSWIPEHYFNSPKLINDYKASLDGEPCNCKTL